MNARTQSPAAAIAATVTQLQNVQKRNRPDSDAWQNASRELVPLYARIAALPAAQQREVASLVSGMFLPPR